MRRTILILAALGAFAFPATASGASGADYLATRQQPGGGFAEAGSSSGSVALTAWAVMGLTAAGRNSGAMHRPGGHTPVYFMAALNTGLYVAARAQFEGVTPDSGDHSSQTALSGVAGWRVRQSEWRASITAKATRSTR